MKLTIVAIAATSLTAFAAAANAAAPASEVRVVIDDLDLASGADRERLDRRIDRAVRKVCATGMRGVVARQHELACRDTALAAAEEPKRTAIANAHRERLRLAGVPAARQGS